jgi:PAS domain S-box-containing protein
MIRVLFIERDRVARNLAKEYSRLHGDPLFDTAATSKTALRRIGKTRYDAIVLGRINTGEETNAILQSILQGQEKALFIVIDATAETLKIPASDTICQIQKSPDEPHAFDLLALKIQQGVHDRNRANGAKAITTLPEDDRRIVSILNEIILQSSRSESLEVFLKESLDSIIRLLDFDAGGIYLVNPKAGTATVACEKNLPREFLSGIKTVKLDEPPFDTLFVRNKPLITSNYADISPERSNRFGFASLASVPLMVRGKTIGALNVVSRHRHQITGKEEQMLISIGRELGSTIERMTANENARRSAENLSLLFNSIDEMIFILDMEGHILMVNDTAIRRLRFSRNELIGMGVLSLHVPERRDEALQIVQGMIAGTVDTCPVPLLAKDGTRIEVETKVTRGIWDGSEVLVGVTRDITQRKRIEQELTTKTLELEQYFTTSLDLFCIADTNGYFRRLNPQWEKTLGYPLSEIEGAKFLDFVHPDDMQATLGSIEDLVNRREVVNFTNRYRHKDGSYRWIEWRSFPRPESKLIFAAARDITQRKNAEEELRARKDELRLLLDSTEEAIYGLDIQGRCTLCNPSCLQMLGYADPAELLGKSMHELIHHPGEDGTASPKEECRILQAILQGKGTHADDEVLWRKDGTSFPAEYWSHPQIRDGKIVGAVVTFMDISERKKTEKILAQRTALLVNLLDSIPDIVFFKDIAGSYLGCNPNFAEFVGKPRGEIIGRTDYDLFSREVADLFRINDAIMMREGIPRHNEEWITYPDGHRLLIDTLKAPLITVEGKVIGILGISRDITERKRNEQAIVEASRKLNTLNSITRHDVLNQITALDMMLQILKEITSDKESLDLISKAQDSTNRLTRQVQFTREYQDIGVQAPKWQSVSACIGNAQKLLDVCPFEVEVKADLPRSLQILSLKKSSITSWKMR